MLRKCKKPVQNRSVESHQMSVESNKKPTSSKTVSPCREKPPQGISNKDYREEVGFGFEGVGKRLEMAAEM